MQHVARTEQLLFRVYGLMFYSEVSETKLESAQSVKVSPLQQAHMQAKNLNIGQFTFSLCLRFHLQGTPTQLILKQNPPTSEVHQQTVTQKFITKVSHTGLWRRKELGKEIWQSVRLVICKLFQQVTRLLAYRLRQNPPPFLFRVT